MLQNLFIYNVLLLLLPPLICVVYIMCNVCIELKPILPYQNMGIAAVYSTCAITLSTMYNAQCNSIDCILAYIFVHVYLCVIMNYQIPYVVLLQAI